MTGFSIDWLDLREGADRRARDEEMLEQARLWMQTDNVQEDAKVIVDLGAGTGSTLRAFTLPTGQDPPSWRLVDQDVALLKEANARHGGACQLETYELDLANIDALPLCGAKLITTSALFDLVSADFIDSFVAVLKSQQQPPAFYAALNYDGTTCWTPSHPLDEIVLSAFNRDQRRDKGFGVALGPEAGLYMERLFKSFGFKVFTADSPWVLDGADNKLVNSLISGIGDAVATDPQLDAAELQDWVQFRKKHSATGSCEVGHMDLLALPDSV